MFCKLCVKYSDGLLGIFKEEGVQMGIADIIGLHFWFKLHSDDDIYAAICPSCWLKLNNFHQFYKMVEQAHSVLADNSIKKEPLSELMDIEFIDPDLSIKEEPDEKTNSKAKKSTDNSSEDINQFCELEMPSSISNEATNTETDLLNPFSELSSHKIKNDIFEKLESKNDANNLPKVAGNIRHVNVYMYEHLLTLSYYFA
uniref:Transcription factor grauzone n=1 Tax=Bactrocera dorsalis TaxID=27457 RepID=A0A034VT35_BACDO